MAEIHDTNAADNASCSSDKGVHEHGFTNGIVKVFLDSNLSLILILLAIIVGLAALLITPREEDPQIIVPLADVHVSFPGHSAEEVEQLVSTPLEKLLYHIDGVEYVYSQSRRDHAIITVRFYVGEDREDSLVKLYKRIDEHIDTVPPGVTGWVVKPIEIDDVPIVTLALTSDSADSYTLRRVGEEMVDRLAAIDNISRAYAVGGEPRVVSVYLDPDRMHGYSVSPLEIRRAVEASNITRTAGDFTQNDEHIRVEIGESFSHVSDLDELVVGVHKDKPVFLRDVADIIDGPDEITSYVRHGWGPARGTSERHGFTGTIIGASQPAEESTAAASRPAVTIALAKKKGTNAVWVADEILNVAETLKRDVLPDDIDVVVTRNYGLTADDKVNELVEALGVAVILVILVLGLGLGWREAIIVALAVPVVFGLTLTVNLLFGFTINRVTLFALILSIGLLVDDPIVDVENITRHFGLQRKATRAIVLEAVAEIRPPLITATLAVIVSFLPMFFITGMMGPYMRPMALNVPIAMFMSMLVAFTITPWLSYHLLKGRYKGGSVPIDTHVDPHDISLVKQTPLYKLFYPLMAPLLHSRMLGILFLAAMAGLTVLAAGLAATRDVPLKMLPFDNKNELLLVLDFDETTTLERSDAAVRALELYLARVPEVTDFTSYVGLASPMDFNGMVRHYYLRQGANVAEIRINLADKFMRRRQSHAIGLRLRDDLTAIAGAHGALLKLVETPPGPPVISTVVAEVYGRPEHTYNDLIEASAVVRKRFEAEPHVVDVDDTVEADSTKLIFVTDKEKAAINGVSTADIAATLRTALAGESVGVIHEPHERNPLAIELRLPRPIRSDPFDLSSIHVKGLSGSLVPLAEIGAWHQSNVERTIHHKNMRPVVYVLAETAGRAPAEAIIDMQVDRADQHADVPADAFRTTAGWAAANEPRHLAGRTFLTSGSDVKWFVPDEFDIEFAGEGEWQITLDVFRDLGMAFAAALVGIYILLVAQTRSFVIPGVVMLAIPLTILGIMPGFWLLNMIATENVGQYANPIFFTATGMIGMIALAGIVTRDSIILVDFIHLSLRRGRTLFEAIMESRVVRLRPILLTTGTAMLSAVPITIDPIFSGLAWSLIFGLMASTVFTLFVIPITYWLVYADKPGHGLPVLDE